MIEEEEDVEENPLHHFDLCKVVFSFISFHKKEQSDKEEVNRYKSDVQVR